MTQEERVRRAYSAKELLDNQSLQDAFKDVREGLVSSLEGCKWGEDAKQKNIMLSLQLLKGLRGVIEAHINDGKVAQKEIDRFNDPKVKRVV